MALDWYEFETAAVMLRTPGFWLHPTIEYVGCSPDAIVPLVKTVQAKCPGYAAWIDTRLSRKVPSEYRWQCKWEAWVVGVREFDFFCWHPSAGGVIVPGEVTAEECAQMAERAELIDGKVREMVARLTDAQQESGR
jgi:hypothetical protein